MKNVPPQQIAELQKFPANIRNICILAHVDHGKTTLADALVASNGIISQRMAGKMRYMDNWEEEQLRGITMKSSAISLLYQATAEQRYLVNLIDSPGHVDFSSEVSTAVRLCDGALILVDVVEGVCPQTQAVLRQAWLEEIRPVLVLNKVDRLVLDLGLAPLEAYHHLQQILEQMNLITSQLFTSETMEKFSAARDALETSADSGGVESTADTQSYDWTVLEDENEAKGKSIYFSPDRGNVIFASAVDGWGFSIGQFADMLSAKLGVNREVLRKTLWGDFFYSSKNKRIMRGAQSKGKTPLFVQFVLSNLWSVYDAVMVAKDKEKVEKIIRSLSLTLAPRDSRHADPRVQLSAITSQWLPVSRAVLSVVVELLPSPLQMSEERVEKLLCSQNRAFHSYPPSTQALKSDFLACSSSDKAPVIVFISKMFPVDAKSLPGNKQRPLTEEELQQRKEEARARHAQRMAQREAGTSQTAAQNGSCSQSPAPTSAQLANGEEAAGADQPGTEEEEEATAFVAFGRIFSGTVRRGQRIFLLGPKHDPASALQLQAGGQAGGDGGSGDTAGGCCCPVQEVSLDSLFLLMGRELEELEEVPAGNILGIGGLEGQVLKSATLASTLACPAFTDLYFDAHPIVRVAVEPARACDMGKLVRGLKLLNQADPCVRVLVQETGEHVIVTAGEVHLKHCIDDLQERYAKVEVVPSEPIVPFRETIVDPPRVDRVNESIHSQGGGSGKPLHLLEFQDDEEVLGRGLVRVLTPNRRCCLQIRAVPLPAAVSRLLVESQELLQALARAEPGGLELGQATLERLRELRAKLEALFKAAGRRWRGAVDQIWSFGPKNHGPNLLLNRVEGHARPSVWACLQGGGTAGERLRDFSNSVESGFQLATLAGPLCEEPMHGVAFALEKWDFLAEEGQQASSAGTTPSEGENAGKEAAGNGAAAQTEAKSDGESQDVAEVSGDQQQQHQKQQQQQQQQEVYGPMSGQLMATVKEGCRKAFRTQPQRLMAATYTCTIQATADVLGKLYGVLGKRHGRILSEEMREGTQFFSVEAELPVVESFGFTEDIRKKTSGLASPQLRFSHWEVVDIDPFWVPTTEEEYMHFGDKADSENRARKYMNDVRKRKGLKVDEKIVQHAEKQRNLSKNK